LNLILIVELCVFMLNLKHFDGILYFSPTKCWCRPKARKGTVETIINPPLNFTRLGDPSQPTQVKRTTNKRALRLP
jgi:hypothetical protein